MNKEERELIELAAKASGIKIEFDEASGLFWLDNKYTQLWWNPLYHDGDSVRLEAALGINVEWDDHNVRCSKTMPLTMDDAVFRGFYEDHDGDRQAARRMASLRVAAAVGKAMK